MKYTVPVLKYVIPNGFDSTIEVEVDKDTATKAQDLISLGFSFELEVLRDGALVVSCEHSTEEYAVAVNIIPPSDFEKTLNNIIHYSHKQVKQPIVLRADKDCEKCHGTGKDCSCAFKQASVIQLRRLAAGESYVILPWG